MKKFIKKHCYLAIPLFTVLLYLIIYIINIFFDFTIFFSLTDDVSTMIQISGTLIGFLLTAITVFLSLPKNTDLMKKIKRYNHDKIFANCVLIGLFLSTLTILLWLFNCNYIILIMIFILSLEETLMSAYYIYKLSIYNFQ